MQPEAVARALHAIDPSAESFGIELIDASPNGSVVRMLVRPDMCNGFGMIHGGMTFLLADSAMAFASNSDNQMALASSAEIDWIAPVEPGQVLVATAVLRSTTGRSMLWDISVTIEGGDEIALIRGRTRRVRGHVIAET